MAKLELLDFQQEAANKLVEGALTYFESGPDRIGGRSIPYVGQLRAVTGAGKTPILAATIGRIGPSIVLWTTKFGGVVDQTAANLRLGGKYHHLLNGSSAGVIKFGDIPSSTEWRRILDCTDGLTILVSTVAAWNSSEKDPRLNVHRVNADWGDTSRWDQLKADRKRPLWVVYDEAHNTTTEQVELLDDLDPAGFFVAGASPLKGKLQLYLTSLPEDQRNERIIPVSTRAVVDAQLLKSTISLADYDSSTEEMLSAAAGRRRSLATALQAHKAPVTPKAIYVVETSNPTARGSEPRPSAIWRMLVNNCDVAPHSIAVCTNTKDLPKGAVRVETIDQLSEQYTHIIFNKRLQEGWDDPSVYVCYFDGKTDSATRIEQVIGRALRQPDATHFDDEDLNTAYFFVNCPTDTLEKIADQLKEELQIYKGDETPTDFEPFQIKEERKALPKIELKPQFLGKLKVPRLQAELPPSDHLRTLVERKTYDFSEADRAAPGRALVQTVSVRTGDMRQDSRDLFEDMRVRCGVYLQEQIRMLSRNCANSIHPDIFSNEQLDKTACFKSKALEHYRTLATEVVSEYENHVLLRELVDPTEREYTVGPYQPSGTAPRGFNYACHACYDAKSFREDELTVAKALDRFPGYVWVRNKDRLDYGIPLPIKCGTSSTFYPDFIWWVRDTIWAIDPTGKFILEEKIRTKLLMVPMPLRIALVTPGKYDSSYRKLANDGWTLVRYRVGNLMPEKFDTIEEVLSTLVSDS